MWTRGVFGVCSILATAFIAILALTVPSLAVDTDKFHVKTTSDLVALCSADPAAENYVAAVHFCHGFASGAFRYYQSVAAAQPAAKYICTPDPAPSRNEVIAAFVNWARKDKDAMGAPATDSMFRYLAAKYPCQQ
jgi:hypothetical protein